MCARVDALLFNSPPPPPIGDKTNTYGIRKMNLVGISGTVLPSNRDSKGKSGQQPRISGFFSGTQPRDSRMDLYNVQDPLNIATTQNASTFQQEVP